MARRSRSAPSRLRRLRQVPGAGLTQTPVVERCEKYLPRGCTALATCGLFSFRAALRSRKGIQK